MAKLVLLPSTSLQFIGSFYRHPARLQNGALRQPASESVQIRIGTTVPDPSLRIIILLIFTYYFSIRFRLPTCPSSSDRPTHGTPVGKFFALRTHIRPQSSSKISSKVCSMVSSGASPSVPRSLPASPSTSGWIGCCSGSS